VKEKVGSSECIGRFRWSSGVQEVLPNTAKLTDPIRPAEERVFSTNVAVLMSSRLLQDVKIE